jgi:hypothetical protein
VTRASCIPPDTVQRTQRGLVAGKCAAAATATEGGGSNRNDSCPMASTVMN